jgi:hypothetical protein
MYESKCMVQLWKLLINMFLFLLHCSDVLLVLFFYCFVYGYMFCILLFNSVSYVFLLLCLCILVGRVAQSV